MCMELGMHLCFAFARWSSTLRGQTGYISVLLAHRRPSECSVLCSCGQPREIPVLLPLVVHSFIRQTFKLKLEVLGALRPTNSPWGLLLWRRRPHHPVGFSPWPLPWRVEPGPTVGGSYCGPLQFNCLSLPWRQLRMKCRHFHSPNIRGVACRRQLSTTLEVSRLLTAGVAA